MAMTRTRYWAAGLLVVALVAGAAWYERPLPVSGPWGAQIVDAETEQPLEGVIVLALWEKRTFAWPHPDRHYHDLDEAVTDAAGRFVIPARVTASRHPLELTIGPLLTIFKPGYGQWHYQGRPATSGEEATAESERNGQRFARGGAVMVLPRTKTREERIEILDRLRPDPEVPTEKYPRLLTAYNQERVRLGFSPRR